MAFGHGEVGVHFGDVGNGSQRAGYGRTNQATYAVGNATYYTVTGAGYTGV